VAIDRPYTTLYLVYHRALAEYLFSICNIYLSIYLSMFVSISLTMYTSLVTRDFVAYIYIWLLFHVFSFCRKKPSLTLQTDFQQHSTETVVLVEPQATSETLPTPSLPPLHPRKLTLPVGMHPATVQEPELPTTPSPPLSRRPSETPKTVTPSGLTMRFQQFQSTPEPAPVVDST